MESGRSDRAPGPGRSDVQATFEVPITYAKNDFWIDADDIGLIPVPPEPRRSPTPPGVNCADATYDD